MPETRLQRIQIFGRIRHPRINRGLRWLAARLRHCPGLAVAILNLGNRFDLYAGNERLGTMRVRAKASVVFGFEGPA